MDRRKFLQSAAATTFMTSLGKKFAHAANTSIVPTRVLGHTGEKISMVGLGGYHIGMQSDEQESIRIIRTSLDSGITFLDNCWDYNNGQSEIRMGKALRDGYRQKSFPDDEDRWADEASRCAATGRVIAPPADRPNRPVAVSRGHS